MHTLTAKLVKHIVGNGVRLFLQKKKTKPEIAPFSD